MLWHHTFYDDLWLPQIARRKRLAEMHSRMQRQLAEKQARDQAEAEKHEAQSGLRAVHNARMDAWKSGKKVRIYYNCPFCGLNTPCNVTQLCLTR